MKNVTKRTPLKKAQAGKSIKTDTTPNIRREGANTGKKADATPKIIRWEGGNTGKKAPAYMLDSTGNPKPQYAKALKEKHKLRLGGKTATYGKESVANNYQAGGRSISQKAATRKTSKGKGFISSTMGPNPSGDKGAYTPFTKQGKQDAKKTGVVSNKEMKSSRKILQKGGTKRKTTKK